MNMSIIMPAIFVRMYYKTHTIKLSYHLKIGLK